MDRKHHGCDLRKGRVSMHGQCYLVTAVTHERKSIFDDFNAGRIVVKEIVRSEDYGWTETLAFVVMPDHIHWLFSLTENISLSSVVANMKRHSARQINNSSGCQGSRIWQRGFHDHALRKDEDVIHVARYIVSNPLRAGLVSRIGDYSLWDAAWL